MRLLYRNKDGTFHLEHFPDKERIPRYAILSHTWLNAKDEPTFEDISKGSGSEKKGYAKLLFCSDQALEDGLHWFWADTCCIDKSNNVELTTAINSMYRWYQAAERCYVYLHDYTLALSDKTAHIETWQSILCNSHWFKRGWTLQELLAPRSVDFYSRDKLRLGNKETLREWISEATGIPEAALVNTSLSEFSIDERFSWTENRQTKMEEDMVYCLLGIFEVSLPLIYGEGLRNAERRLRKEIIETLGLQPHQIRSSPVTNSRGRSRQGPRATQRQIHQGPVKYNIRILAPFEQIYVAVIGQYGSGKSSMIARLVGGSQNAAGNRVSEDAGISISSFALDGNLAVHLIDTPGFDDQQIRGTDVLESLSASLEPLDSVSHLHGVLYLRDISQRTYFEPVAKSMPLFETLCGKGCLDRIVLATTHWDDVDPIMGGQEEKALTIADSSFWYHMHRLGSPICRVTESRYSALAAIEWILRRTR